ncbi:hypothetical protein [Algisphaera agarilytica]|uniref:Uncharacterized protein n=1 Tax=Algisphaera agarilytica TaxID=1385975 RepID=A0A7X0H4P1_9BACT|nr:hypothetical protein [Algisphaera agarilytica]MBB6429233.1 hypothetical protein [Algisphaera agarilytica]
MNRRPDPFGDSLMREVENRRLVDSQARHEGSDPPPPPGVAVELFEVVSQTAGDKVVGKQIIDGEVPEGAAEVDLLAPFTAWKVNQGDTVAAYSLADGTWRLLSEPPTGAAEYQVPMADADGLLIFSYPRAH